MTQTKFAYRIALTTPLFFSLAACADDEGRPGGVAVDTGQVPADDGTSTGEPSNNSEDDAEPACVPGSQNDCNCGNGLEGFQVCNNAGSGYDACMCDSADTTDDGEDETTAAPDPCGNDVCEEDLDETCDSCEADCGTCLPCAQAPSCDGAEIPPANPVHATALDDPMAYIPPPAIAAKLAQEVGSGSIAARIIAAALSEPDVDESELIAAFRVVFDAHPGATDTIRRQLAVAGMNDPQAYSVQRTAPTTTELLAFAAHHLTFEFSSGPLSAAGTGPGLSPDSDPAAGGSDGDACANTRMRVRVARLVVHEEDDDFANDEIYCAITTEGSDHAEIKVTPLTTPLDEGDSVDFSLDGGLIWGQNELVAPAGNLIITYNCIEQDSDSGYSDLLMALSGAAGMVDGKEIGVDGWVFPAVGVVTGLLAGALTLDGDDLLFNASQIISEAQMLELIYGAWWSVRRDGTNIFSDWDWELRMEMWGCHNYGTGSPPPG